MNFLLTRLKKIQSLAGGTASRPPDSFRQAQNGQGFFFRGKKFVSHTDLQPRETALYTFAPGQRLALFVLAGVFAVSALASWRLTVMVLLTLITLLYFFDALFNILLIYYSFSRQPEIGIDKAELDAASARPWPSYTIFCPLYKEWQVLPQFVRAIKSLDYPARQLQVLLLLEEDDKRTIAEAGAMALPENFEVVTVPHSEPKTKPKALNYGLKYARGEYAVIYDAEDIPDPQQLKKAVIAFDKSGPGTMCIQAKLNFYNPKQNLLTRIFTAEYSLWFDLVLPGLQSVAAPMPLGGTSNHFRTKDLRMLQGWDAFNVTEDCDLGIRLAKRGYKTAIIDSTTWEEANSGLLNWYRQRSRWIKGYMQTYLVHMRQWKQFLQNRKFRDLAFFQLTVGGKVVSIFINPIMWLLTISYFAFRPQVGAFIESFFPAPLLYMGVFSFVFGNFFYLYQYMIGCAKRGFDGLVKYAFLVPLYWIGMSFSAWKALFEIFFQPHYWAKTVHGFHLKSKKSQTESPALPPAAGVWAGVRRALSRGGYLVAALAGAGFLNFLFNAYIGRAASFEQIGVVTFFNTLTVFFGVIFAALSSAVNHRSAYLLAKSGEGESAGFLRVTDRRTFWAALGLSLVWLLSIPAASRAFHIPDWWLWLSFTPAIIFGMAAAPSRGFLHGTMRFSAAGAVILLEALVKLAAAVVLIRLGYHSWIMLALPLSLAASFLASLGFIRYAERKSTVQGQKAAALPYRFPRRLFAAAILTGLSSVVLLNMDVVLAKSFLGPQAAGEYALLSLAGKIVFFFGALLNVLIVTYVGRDEGRREDPGRSFYRILAGTAGLVALGWAGIGLAGPQIVPWLLGEKTLAITHYLLAYASAIALFTFATTFTIYHMARKNLALPLLSLAAIGLLAYAIFKNHDSIKTLVDVMLAASLAYLGAVLVMHALQRNGRFLARNLVDLVDAFYPLRPAWPAGFTGKRILIFNWRDTRHAFAGGAETYIHELAKRWVGDGHRVLLFCGNDGTQARAEMIDGVYVVRRGGFYLVYLWAFLYYMLQFRGRFDLILDCQNGIPFFAPLYAKERVVCLLHHVHQKVFYRYLSKPLAFIAAILENRLMPWVYRDVRFITISDSSKSDMENLELGLSGIDIVQPGVDLELLRPGPKDKNPLVLYLGRLKAYKSVDVLLRAFVKVAEVLPQARLAVVGSGEEEENLKEMAKDLGLGGKVCFTGRVAEKEKVRWLQRAWVLVNPSLMEGWGITTIEANACGVPVVASNVPGLRDSVKNPHTGYLVEYGNPDAFGEKILRLLEDEGLRLRMGRQARVWSRKFGWDKSAKKGLKILYN